MNCEGKTILITGASKGIGKEIALRLADAKPKMLICVSDSKEELDQVGGKDALGGSHQHACHMAPKGGRLMPLLPPRPLCLRS